MNFKSRLTMTYLRPIARVFLVCLLVVASFVTRANASWQVIHVSIGELKACYFFDEQSGMVAGQISLGIFTTTDGGRTWTKVLLPRYSDGIAPDGEITQFLMTDRLNGWLTCEPNRDAKGPSRCCLYRTQDGGASWQETSLVGSASDVYITSSALIVTSRYLPNDLPTLATGWISRDNGKTFEVKLPVSNGIDFVDDKNGVVTGFHTQIWYHTTDGGLTWNNLAKTDDIESWSVYGVKGTSNFFAAPEGYLGSVGITSIRLSNDKGATWSAPGYNLSFQSTGHIAGFGSTLYVQVDSIGSKFNTSSGIWRSTDNGRAWISIGGPSNDQDTRFQVLGCRGEIIYAFDLKGNVWKTIDGGDGSIPQFKFPSFTSLKADSIPACSYRDTTVSVSNLGCDTIYLTNVDAPATPPLDVLDPNTNLPQTFPIAVPPGKKGTVKLRLRPQQAGAYQTWVAIALERDGVFSYDTIAVITGVKYVNPLTLSANILQFDSLVQCDTERLSLRIDNPGCFAVWLDSAQLRTKLNFGLTSPAKNDSIQPGGHQDISVWFNPQQLDKNADSLIVNLVVMGRRVRYAVPVVGYGVSDNPSYVISLGSSIDFGTIGRCPDTVAFAITNPGCTYLHVQIALLDSTKTKAAPSQFTMFGPYPNPKVKDSIKAGERIIAAVIVLPTSLGKYMGYLRVIHRITGEVADTDFIPYTVNVESSRQLQLDDSHRDFDTISFCGRDSITVPLTSIGCDMLVDSGYIISDPDFMVLHGPNLPDAMAKGSTENFVIGFVPTKSGYSSGTITFRTNADSSGMRTIRLTGYARPTDTVRFHATATQLVVVPGDTSDIIVMPSQNFTNPGLSHIGLTFQYNGDVMEPFLIGGVNTEVGNATPPVVGAEKGVAPGSKYRQIPVDITGKNLQLDPTKEIVKMRFRIMISDSSETDFHITRFELNHGDSSFTNCLLGSASDSGTMALSFRCGDSLLYKELRFGANFSPDDGISPLHSAVQPNPVRSSDDNITIPIKALRPVVVSLDVNNMAGENLYSVTRSFDAAGQTALSVPTQTLPSGVYHYRIHPTDGGRGVVTGEFVVLH